MDSLIEKQSFLSIGQREQSKWSGPSPESKKGKTTGNDRRVRRPYQRGSAKAKRSEAEPKARPPV